MEDKMPVGEYGYSLDGGAYFIAAHIPNGYLAYPVYESEDGDEVDETSPVRIANLFSSPPTEKYSEDIKKFQIALQDLKQQENECRESLRTLRGELSQAERLKKEVELEFPFLETALKVQKGELPFFVRKDGFCRYRVCSVKSEWGNSYPEALRVAVFSLDRRGKHPLSVESEVSFFASEKDAKAYAREQIIKAMHDLAISDDERRSDIESYIKQAEEDGIDVPPSVMIRKLTRDLNAELSRVESYTKYIGDSSTKAKELKKKIAELEKASRADAERMK